MQTQLLTLVFTALAFIPGVVLGQGDVPECVLTCVASAASAAGCQGPTDLTCICSSQAFVSSAAVCIATNCPNDGAAAQQLLTTECQSVISTTPTTTPPSSSQGSSSPSSVESSSPASKSGGESSTPASSAPPTPSSSQSLSSASGGTIFSPTPSLTNSSGASSTVAPVQTVSSAARSNLGGYGFRPMGGRGESAVMGGLVAIGVVFVGLAGM